MIFFGLFSSDEVIWNGQRDKASKVISFKVSLINSNNSSKMLLYCLAIFNGLVQDCSTVTPLQTHWSYCSLTAVIKPSIKCNRYNVISCGIPSVKTRFYSQGRKKCVPIRLGSVTTACLEGDTTFSKDHFVYVPSQWETTLPCNVVSHWLGTYTEWSLI